MGVVLSCLVSVLVMQGWRKCRARTTSSPSQAKLQETYSDQVLHSLSAHFIALGFQESKFLQVSQIRRRLSSINNGYKIMENV